MIRNPNEKPFIFIHLVHWKTINVSTKSYFLTRRCLKATVKSKLWCTCVGCRNAYLFAWGWLDDLKMTVIKNRILLFWTGA